MKIKVLIHKSEVDFEAQLLTEALNAGNQVLARDDAKYLFASQANALAAGMTTEQVAKWTAEGEKRAGGIKQH